MLRFMQHIIPGPHTTLLAQPPNLHLRESMFFGLRGVSVIMGQQTDREVSAEIWLTKREWVSPRAAELFAEMKFLDLLVGEFGILREESVVASSPSFDGLPRTFPDCQFVGFTPLAIPGQQAPGPLRDVAGSLHNYAANAQSYAWLQYGRLVWRQLSASSNTSA